MHRIWRLFLSFILLSLLLQSGILSAQDLKVENVRFKDLGEKIVIEYDLMADASKKYEISLSLSDNGGKRFRIVPKALSGDIGRGIKAGRGKKIVWKILKDYPYGIMGNDFVFKVEAKYRKKKSYFWFYTLGICTVVTLRYMSRKTEKSGMVIEVPAYY